MADLNDHKDIRSYANFLLGKFPELTQTEPIQKAFFLVWKDGSTENLYGASISEAFTRKGYRKSLISFIDYYKELT